MSEAFEGFVPPTKNFFHMPNEWINICASINNLAELKVVQYVLRHTWGYREYGILKTISVDEFMHGRKHADGTRMDKGTGLKSDRSVKDGIKAAIEHGYLICEVDNSDQARTKKSYALKMVNDGGRNYPPVETTPGRNYLSEVQNLPPGGTKSTPRSEKDTLERNSGKKERKQSVVKSDSSSHSSTHSSLIANQTTQKIVESLTTGNTPSSCLSPEEERIQGYWCQLGMTERPSAKTHWATLSKHIHSFEDMKNLYEYARVKISDDPHFKSKKINPGNLAHADILDGWKQEQAPPHKPKSSQQGRPKSLAELNAEKMQYAGITARK